MKSSTGKYYLGLDQIRGVAVFMVFVWHFIHLHHGHKSGPVIFPLNVFAEGHTGVSLFMVLSGYLFAKLLDGKKIIYHKFMFNRLIRLLPLLIFAIIVTGIIGVYDGLDLKNYLRSIIKGIWSPSLPNGGWSITIEFHFYLILPILLFLIRKWKYALFVVLALAISVRVLLYLELAEIQTLSYWTIVGRIDQFLLGILAFQFRKYTSIKKLFVFSIFLAYFSFYYYFDYNGGFYVFPSYPSSNPIWIIMPTIEGAFYAFVISWYDNNFKPVKGIVFNVLAKAGKYSYSIYLLHFFFVFKMAMLVDIYLIDLSNIYVAILFAIPCFLFMIPVGYLGFKFIELPFLKFRTKYIADDLAEKTSNTD